MIWSGLNYCLHNCTIRSSKVGIPKGRSLIRPEALSSRMYWRRTGEGLNVACLSFSLSLARHPCSSRSKLLLVVLSTPAVRLPLLDFTFSQASASQSSRQRRLYRSPKTWSLSFSAFRLSFRCISLTITVPIPRFSCQVICSEVPNELRPFPL
jgi:hypothetical protein